MHYALSLKQFAQFITAIGTDYGKVFRLNRPRLLDSTTAIFPLNPKRDTLDLMLTLDAGMKIAGLKQKSALFENERNQAEGRKSHIRN